MSNIILNEGYEGCKILFERGENDQIFFKNKAYIDLANCSGTEHLLKFCFIIS